MEFAHQPVPSLDSEDWVPTSVCCSCGWSNGKRTRASASPAIWRRHAVKEGMTPIDAALSEAAHVEAMLS